MNLWKKAKLGFAAWRAYRKGTKMATSLTGATTSTTTQNVAMGTGGALGAIAAVMVLAATLIPGASAYLTTDVQAAVLVLAGTVAVPLVSRVIAMRRHPAKLVGADPPVLPPEVAALAVVRVSIPGSGDIWQEFRGSFEAAVDLGANMIHCSDENVYRQDGSLAGKMPLPENLK